jgi:exodeoxyribonuclease-3
MRIATWNVNSVRSRIEHLVAWLKDKQPDVLCLQELKCQDEQFPRSQIEDLGYNVAVHGQKSYNGVAILSKHPIDEATPRLPGNNEDVHSRYLEAVISTKDGAVRVASIYLPNGNPIGSEKFTYKLSWMDRLAKHASELLALEEPVVLAGDFNVIPTPLDAEHPERWTKDALFQPETRGKYRELLSLGFTDALRTTHDGKGLYTFWDYFAGNFEKNNGIRIDHLLLSPLAADRLQSVAIDKQVRAAEKPSDHVPIYADFRFATR